MSKAKQMASDMTDQWERLQAVWFAVRAAVFGAILSIYQCSCWFDGSRGDDGCRLMTSFLFLAEILGYVAIAGLSLGGVVATLSLHGTGQTASAGWAVTSPA